MPPPQRPYRDRDEAPQTRWADVPHTGPGPWVQLRNATYHSWIFRKMIARSSPDAHEGDLVTVYDRDGTCFGVAMLNRRSLISLRMLQFGPGEADESLLQRRLEEAVALRLRIGLPNDTTKAYRVVNSEGDGLSGLVVDRYGEYAVCEIFSLGYFHRQGWLTRELKRLLGVEEVIFRADEQVQELEGFSMGVSGPAGDTGKLAPERKSTVVLENGVKFQVDLVTGHKTGFFCDQRENRALFAQLCGPGRVLDACCYSGGFGIYGLVKGAATHVTAVDLDERAEALARRNANLNKIAPARYTTVHSDSFAYLRQMYQNKQQFSAVVLDPPKFIPSQDDYDEGRKKYFDLNKLGLLVTAPGGIMVTCSCSGLLTAEELANAVRGAGRAAGRRVQVLRSSGPGMDHPVDMACPESSYLKVLWLRVE
jgi:23S rRNA (cytosine1962-C5)-methyltransferase